MMADRLILIRHGETEWSADGRHTGRTDITLTRHGRVQAVQLGEAIADETFAAVLTSPLSRAQDTIDLAGYGPVAVELADLVEWDYGDYEGTRTVDVRAEIPGWSVWTHPIHGGESVDEVGGRADRVIARTDEVEATVALAAHGHFLRILAARWLGLPAGAGRHLGLDTATVSELGHERDHPVIRRWNQGCHLRPVRGG
jgi:probable phosphoglycerate mutase